MFLSQREVLDSVMCHPVEKRGNVLKYSDDVQGPLFSILSRVGSLRKQSNFPSSFDDVACVRVRVRRYNNTESGGGGWKWNGIHSGSP